MRSDRLSVLLVVALCGAACTSRVPSGQCSCPDEPASALDVTTTGGRRHLRADARAAEEIAIRHADVTRGHRSGHYTGPVEYRDTRDRCVAALSDRIASRHGILPAQVAGAVGERDPWDDALVLLLFAAVFGTISSWIAARVFARFSDDERWPAVISLVAVAGFLGVAGLPAGALGASVVEMMRVGDTHLSYRALRGPWVEHRMLMLAGEIALFFAMAAARWRRSAG